jgi:HD-GYP domain-containing protein (c-di-GMP phosphodiesterase class II)
MSDVQTNHPEGPQPLGEQQLRLGVYVWIDLPWTAHPFLRNRFRISSDKQLKTLRELGPKSLYWIPALSDAAPLPPVTSAATPPSPPPPPAAPVAVATGEQRLRRQRLIAARIQREWDASSQQVRESLLGMRDNPKQAGAGMRDLAARLASAMNQGPVLLQLLGKQPGEGLQHHALNCMTLSMLLARSMNLSSTTVGAIGLGALAHDIGKLLIPAHVLRAENRSSVQESWYREHCRLGVELATDSGAFSEHAIAAIRDHHEALDGSGFPAGKLGPQIGVAARIVAIANRYDRLCSPESPKARSRALLPAEALKTMWRDEQARLDPSLLAALVRLLGVYPPGTLVKLSDGSLALSVSPGKSSLLPKVLIHDPDIDKSEALLVDLADTAGQLSVEKSLHPDEMPEDALAWLNPRESLTYYFSDESVD